MVKTGDEESSSDLDDSFRTAPKLNGKTKPRAIIDSSESEDEVSKIIHCEEERPTEKILDDTDPNIEDSFDEENNSGTATTYSDDNEKTPMNKYGRKDEDDLIQNSDSENEQTSPSGSQRSNIVEMTDDDDDEGANVSTKIGTKRISSSYKNKRRQSNRTEKSPQSTAELVANNSQYREVAENGSDEESADDDVASKSLDIQSDDSAEVIENSLSIVEVSSEDDVAQTVNLKQSNIKSFLIDTNSSKASPVKQQQRHDRKLVTKAEYEDQVKKINNIAADLLKTKNAMRIIKLENLPDKGKSIVDKGRALDQLLEEHKKKLNDMVVDDSEKAVMARDKIEIAWHEIESGVNAVGPRTFGKKGVARFNEEKQLAVGTLDQIHKSLDTCPTENDCIDDPKGLKVELMLHQKRALAWLLWREKQKPSGGLLADDMGLGKTLTMIALILKSKESEENADVEKENYRDKYPGGTLVVCPASLLNQWSGEIERRTKRGLLAFEVYHGAKRETKPKRLAKHDVVITTYALVLNENAKDGTIFGVRWRRIILDEAHQIRNFKSRTAEAVFRLSGRSRWCLTGTPVHNKELDMYAILKFLRYAPFDDLQIWKHWVGDKSTGGDMRLHAVISSLMLRRTKAELMQKGSLRSLPERKWELIPVKLKKEEMDVYQKVLIFSRTLFAQFLHQRAEKNQDDINLRFKGAPPDANGEYFKMRNKLLKLNRVKEVSQHEILVLLLRLRQICCHPCLIKQMLQGDEDLGNADDEEESEELNLLEQLNKLNINEEDEYNPGISNESGVGLKEASKGYLNPSNPIFAEDHRSSKIKKLIRILKEQVPDGDKAIVVSQWTSLLNLVAIQVKNEGIPYDSLNGTIPVPKRAAIVDNFNDPNSKTKVLLLSLTAGGVGLNLIGANNLFLLDLHWNPQLESQAQDRIYRVGQTKPIYVYKFMAVDTIEERIKCLQDKKLEIADSMLTGSKRVGSSKLSLQDLKMLFDFK